MKIEWSGRPPGLKDKIHSGAFVRWKWVCAFRVLFLEDSGNEGEDVPRKQEEPGLMQVDHLWHRSYSWSRRLGVGVGEKTAPLSGVSARLRPETFTQPLSLARATLRAARTGAGQAGNSTMARDR